LTKNFELVELQDVLGILKRATVIHSLDFQPFLRGDHIQKNHQNIV
jgi:hypothetical protein